MSLVATLVSLLLFNNTIELDMFIELPKAYSTYEYDKSYIQEVLENKQVETEPELTESDTEYTYKNFRQTYYSVCEGEDKLGSLHSYRDSNIKVIDNIMNFNDGEYGYLPIYAVNIDDVYNSGLNNVGTPVLYGSIIELTDGMSTWLGIVLDACGECSRSNKIDLWVYDNDVKHDVENISFKYLRYGWKEN